MLILSPIPNGSSSGLGGKHGAHTAESVSFTRGCSCSQLFHSPRLEAASQVLLKPLFPVLPGLYIVRVCKRNLLQINHNEHALSTVRGNKRQSCTIIRWEAQLQPLEANFFCFTELEKLF